MNTKLVIGPMVTPIGGRCPCCMVTVEGKWGCFRCSRRTYLATTGELVECSCGYRRGAPKLPELSTIRQVPS